MDYPCIVYERDYAQTAHADNAPYRYTQRYMLRVIDKTPDSPLVAKVAMLPMCTYDRFYTADKLNHDVFKLFF